MIIGPEKGYTDLLDEAFQNLPDRDVKYPLRPSSSGRCRRELAYQLLEYEGHQKFERKSFSPQTKRILELGLGIESVALKSFELLTDFEQKYKQHSFPIFTLPTGQTITGSTDVIFISRDHRSICDVKSKKDGFSKAYRTRWEEDIEKYAALKSFRRLTETAFYIENLWSAVHELGFKDFLVDNLLQLNLYACSPFAKEIGITHAFIYRYNKNDSRHLEIRFLPNERAFNYVRDKFIDVVRGKEEAVLKKEPIETHVPRDFELGSLRCAFCSYSSTCYGKGVDPMQEFFKMVGSDTPKALGKENLLSDRLKVYFRVLKRGEKILDAMHKELVELFLKEKSQKVRTVDGDVFELKFLKSPNPHYEVRKAKP